VDIQAMREDISLPGQEVPKYELHVQRSTSVDEHSWAWEPATRTVGMSEIATHPGDDVRADIDLMLARLRDAGIPRVIVVDLSPPQMPFKVVRVIAPRLESWATDYCRIGPRGTTAWQTTLRELINDSPTS
jgi:ribosomal protein S12 methylthiotransferase accessory factor